MIGPAQTVEDYLGAVPDARKEALSRLRSLCQRILNGYDESMQYKMPTYSRRGAGEIAFASQKNYISLYVMKEEVVNRHRAALLEAGVGVGKGCIRYRTPEKIDFGVVEELLKDTVASSADPC